MNEIPVEISLYPSVEKSPITHADTLNALRLWGCHNLADDFAKVLLGAPVVDDPYGYDAPWDRD